jgi:hypothetical protein
VQARPSEKLKKEGVVYLTVLMRCSSRWVSNLQNMSVGQQFAVYVGRVSGFSRVSVETPT